MKLIPKTRRMFDISSSIDWEKTIAFSTDLSGIKSYPYGGIKLNTDLIENDPELDRDEIISKIISLINSIKGEESGSSVVEFIIRREDLYKGEFLDLYPDILLLTAPCEPYHPGQKKHLYAPKHRPF